MHNLNYYHLYNRFSNTDEYHFRNLYKNMMVDETNNNKNVY